GENNLPRWPDCADLAFPRASIVMRAIEPLSLSVFHSNSAVLSIKKYFCGKRVTLNLEQVWMARRNFQQPLPRAAALTTTRRKRHKTGPFGPPPQAPLTVWIASFEHKRN